MTLTDWLGVILVGFPGYVAVIVIAIEEWKNR